MPEKKTTKKKKKSVKAECTECGEKFLRPYDDCRITCPKCGHYFIDIDLD